MLECDMLLHIKYKVTHDTIIMIKASHDVATALDITSKKMCRAHIRAYYKNILLQEDSTLLEYQIHSGSTLQIEQAIHINVKPSSNKNFELEIKPFETISALMENISIEFDISRQMQCITVTPNKFP